MRAIVGIVPGRGERPFCRLASKAAMHGDYCGDAAIVPAVTRGRCQATTALLTQPPARPWAWPLPCVCASCESASSVCPCQSRHPDVRSELGLLSPAPRGREGQRALGQRRQALASVSGNIRAGVSGAGYQYVSSFIVVDEQRRQAFFLPIAAIRGLGGVTARQHIPRAAHKHYIGHCS